MDHQNKLSQQQFDSNESIDALALSLKKKMRPVTTEIRKIDTFLQKRFGHHINVSYHPTVKKSILSNPMKSTTSHKTSHDCSCRVLSLKKHY